MYWRLALIVAIVIIHYAFTNGYEKAIIQQLSTNQTIIKRPNEACKTSSALQCQGMPSGHVECAVIGMVLLWSLFSFDMYLVALVVAIVALQRVIFKRHTVFQTIVGGIFGSLYAFVYVTSPMIYYAWLFPIVYVIVLISIVEHKLHNDPIPQWLSKDLYPIISRKRDNTSLLSKMIFVWTICLTQKYTLYMDWNTLEKFADRIIERFRGENIDIVIGIKSGGAIISDYIAYKLGIPNDYIKIASKCDKSTGETVNEFLHKHIAKKSYKFNICEEVSVDITGKKVLLVDESVATGQTLEANREYLLQKGASQVVLATVESWPTVNSQLPMFVAAPDHYFIVWPWGYDN